MSRITLKSSGWLYAMVSAALCQTSDGHGPLIKIGASTNDPELRAKQLTSSTSSPTAFVVAYSRWVPDVTTAEARAHEMLAYCRVNDRREFFQCTVRDACVVLDHIAGGSRLMDDDPPTPLANLFATFPDNGEPRELTDVERRKVAAVLA